MGEILRYGPALEQEKTIQLKITKCLCTLSSGKCVPYEESCYRLTFRGASSAGFTALCIYCTTSLCNICKLCGLSSQPSPGVMHRVSSGTGLMLTVFFLFFPFVFNMQGVVYCESVPKGVLS